MESIPKDNTPILVADDDVGILSSIEAVITRSGMPKPALVSDSRHIMDLVRQYRFQLVLLDIIMPHISGMDILKQLKKEFPKTECVIITAVDEVSIAVQAMKHGAFDYLVKPFEENKMIIVIRHALERYSYRHGLTPLERIPPFSEIKDLNAFKDMVAGDEKMALVFQKAEIAAVTDYNLLITGETGTGKDMLARIVHKLSNRSRNPFVAINTSASSKALFEDDFFGHVKGAFTGALTGKEGFFESAQGGTLYLDEITELPRELQVKLLRAIEEKEIFRLGAAVPKPVDMRIIASTNCNIYEEIHAKRFREDLFYRLNRSHIHIPPLRERKKDILPLAAHFLNIHAEKNRKNIDSLSPGLSDRLLKYSFPGNVRELDNIIASAVLSEKGSVLSLSSTSPLEKVSDPLLAQTREPNTLQELEKQHILRVLEISEGNRTRAAKRLGIDLRTLRRKLSKFRDQ
ncbi:sigma-54-dependent transcriptional regulator [Thermodesulfobacteriota bacterium]